MTRKYEVQKNMASALVSLMMRQAVQENSSKEHATWYNKHN